MIRSLKPLWYGIRAQWIGWKLSHLDPMAPHLPDLVIRKNHLERNV